MKLAHPRTAMRCQVRICFAWRDGEAWEVEIVDYH